MPAFSILIFLMNLSAHLTLIYRMIRYHIIKSNYIYRFGIFF